jgi:peroxiredoxin
MSTRRVLLSQPRSHHRVASELIAAMARIEAESTVLHPLKGIQMSLQQKLDAFKADFRAGKPPFNAPPEIHPIMERATNELIQSGQAQRALKAGDRAPVFTLHDQNDNPVSSKDLLAKGPLIVSFYRGVWCPYCNLELQALEEALPKFKELGGNLVAISPQNPVNSRKSVRQNNVTFPILSDTKNDVAASFGLRFVLPDYLVDLYKNLKNDLPAFNSDPSWTLPMPARYVIGRDGKIAYAEVNPDYTHRPEPEDMLPVLEAELSRK